MEQPGGDSISTLQHKIRPPPQVASSELLGGVPRGKSTALLWHLLTDEPSDLLP